MSRFFVHPDIATAETIDSDVYNSAEIYTIVKENIFARTWQFVGHTGMATERNSVFPLTLLPNCLDEPLVLTRDANYTLRLLSNVCTHRGNLLAAQPCSATRLRCQYHGRIFDLAGKMQFMPEFQEVKNFPSIADDLPSLPLFQFGNLLFSSLNPATSATAFLGDMQHRVEWLPHEKMIFRPELSKTYEVAANWALYCENYLEGFHIPFVHGGLAATLDFGNYSTEIYPLSNLQLGIAKQNEHTFQPPQHSEDFGKSVAAYYFWVFPNMMFNFYPWGLSLNVVEPTGVNTCRVRFMAFVADDSRLSVGAGGDLDTVEMEDEAIVNKVQQGVRSRLYKKGRYSVRHERGTHHFHRLLAEWIG